MTIKRRIEKLETYQRTGSTYCLCPREFVTELILPDPDESDDDRERRIAQAEEREFCGWCRKEIKVTKIIVEYTNRNAESL